MIQSAIERDISIDSLNMTFSPHTFEARLRMLFEIFDPNDILVTSSFGTRSVFLLHLISEIRPDHEVHFIDTTYHFQETLAYKQLITDAFGLNVVDILPEEDQNALTRDESWWEEHPKMCCTINKIQPLHPIISRHKIWIAGLMAFQTNFRSRLDLFARQGDIIKFHPFLDIDEGEFLYYLSYHNLPRHPLESHGYGSIGCSHCTIKGAGRNGRWKTSGKEECGLHPNFFVRKK